MTDLLGQQFGNYRLTRLLGRGGFAEVYLAEHVRLGMKAAIKILYAHLEDTQVNAFQQEARTIAELSHAHIVRVLDFDVQEGTPFLVLDYAAKGSLRQKHPRDSSVPLDVVVSYVQQIASALQYAHERKLIHRDVKPENMLMNEDGSLLLSDFGIATIAHATSSMATSASLGTLAYMAPEQIQGKPRPASDQYALAVTVYHWLTGTLPFDGSAAEIIAQHLGASPPPLREIRPDLPAAVEQVVLTALAKDPAQRFGSVQAFANAFAQASGQVAASSAPLPPVVEQPQAQTQPSLPPAPIPQPVGGLPVMPAPVPSATPMRNVAFRQGLIFGLPVAGFNLVYILFIYPWLVFPALMQWHLTLTTLNFYSVITYVVVVLVCCIPCFFAGRTAASQTGKMQTGVQASLWIVLWLLLVDIGLDTFELVNLVQSWSKLNIPMSSITSTIQFVLIYYVIFFLIASALELSSGTLGAWFGRRLVQVRQTIAVQPPLPGQFSAASVAPTQQASQAAIAPEVQLSRTQPARPALPPYVPAAIQPQRARPSFSPKQRWVFAGACGLIVIAVLTGLIIHAAQGDGSANAPYHLSASDSGVQNIGITLGVLSATNLNGLSTPQPSVSSSSAPTVTVTSLRFTANQTIVDISVQGSDTYECDGGFNLWRTSQGSFGGTFSENPMGALSTGDNEITFTGRPQAGEEWALALSLEEQSTSNYYGYDYLYLQF